MGRLCGPMWGVVWAWRGFFAGLDGVNVQNSYRMCHFANKGGGFVGEKSNQMGKLHNGGVILTILCTFLGKILFLLSIILVSSLCYGQSLDTLSINEITVVSFYRNSINNGSVIEEKDLISNNYGQEPSHYFAEMPSVFSFSDNGTDFGYGYFRIRGLDQTRVNVTIDGCPWNEAEDFGTYFANSPDLMSSLKSIKLENFRNYESLDLDFEKAFLTDEIKVICGVDEAGRGPLMGPVVAAACILPEGIVIEGLNDSKKLTEKKREKLFDIIKKKAIAYAIAEASPEEIDEINILNASMLAMRRAVEALPVKADFALIDGNCSRGFEIPTETVVSGDAKSCSIAAASILAKVTRDRGCKELDEQYPMYGIAKHKGYPTKDHMNAVREHGPSPIHRKTFLKFLDK